MTEQMIVNKNADSCVFYIPQKNTTPPNPLNEGKNDFTSSGAVFCHPELDSGSSFFCDYDRTPHNPDSVRLCTSLDC